MAMKMTHSSVFVRDQDEALGFYRDILGMEVRTDDVNDGFRWLTVGFPAQPDHEIILMAAQEKRELSAQNAVLLHELLASGQVYLGVLVSDDVMRDYEAWRVRGVKFIAPPEMQPYGALSAQGYDPSGNRFNLIEPRG